MGAMPDSTSLSAMKPVLRRPTRRASSHREALVIAARDLFADAGPAAVSIRAVAEKAGCSHTLVGRQFGSKAGLEQAVIERLTDGLDFLTTRLCSSADWPFAELFHVFRVHPEAGKLMVRCALGEFDDAPLMRGHTIGLCLAGRLETRRGGHGDQPGTEAKLAAYAALSLVMGLVSFEGLLLAGSRAEQIPVEIRDAAMIQAAERLAALAVNEAVNLTYGPGPSHVVPIPPLDLTAMDSRSALIAAAIELYAAKGQAALTTREIADLAQVNQGLIYHYFESRETLLAEAIAVANKPLQLATRAEAPLDLIAATRARIGARSLPIFARLLVNGTDIHSVRSEFPQVPQGPNVADLHEPRLTVMTTSAFSLGVTLWDDILRRMIGIPADADLVPMTAGITEYLLSSKA